jgi:hypothetical protein
MSFHGKISVAFLIAYMHAACPAYPIFLLLITEVIVLVKSTNSHPTVLKEKNIENQKEYNLRYLLAKIRT